MNDDHWAQVYKNNHEAIPAGNFFTNPWAQYKDQPDHNPSEKDYHCASYGALIPRLSILIGWEVPGGKFRIFSHKLDRASLRKRKVRAHSINHSFNFK